MANIFEPGHEISNYEVCAISIGSDQLAHTRSLIRAFASRLNTPWLRTFYTFDIYFKLCNLNISLSPNNKDYFCSVYLHLIWVHLFGNKK